jgi:SET domain-containing protein
MKHLQVKKSKLPKAGKGLFTTKPLKKGTRIAEYRGRITTWKKAKAEEGDNAYIFYVNRNHVIDAKPSRAKARYANDARGLQRIKGLTNNSEYIEDGVKVYIEAKKNIPAGSEILVGYGKEYWDTIRKNSKTHPKNKTNGSVTRK